MPEINSVNLTGNLTRDPELRSTGGGTPVCNMRVASNTRRKDSNGEWHDKPNYFDVTCWGRTAENAATYLAKGRKVGISGRLEWREWEAKDGSGKRQAVEITAHDVVFLGSPGDNAPTQQPQSDTPADTADLPPATAAPVGGAVTGSDDDIPF